jgi:hypothetical protein
MVGFTWSNSTPLENRMEWALVWWTVGFPATLVLSCMLHVLLPASSFVLYLLYCHLLHLMFRKFSFIAHSIENTLYMSGTCLFDRSRASDMAVLFGDSAFEFRIETRPSPVALGTWPWLFSTLALLINTHQPDLDFILMPNSMIAFVYQCTCMWWCFFFIYLSTSL